MHSTKEKRISREKLFMETAILFAKRSTCSRKKVGAVLVRDNRIVATSYNGVPPGRPHGWGLKEDGSSDTIHAEENLIAFCARHGISTEGCTIYLTLSPCKDCAELCEQAGIKEIIYLEQYRNIEGIERFNFGHRNKKVLPCRQFTEL